jgi:polygalacturonase
MTKLIHRILAATLSLQLTVFAGAAHAAITPALPQIPDKTFSLADYGAVGDGTTLNTEAFKKAIRAVREAGGGKLVIPKGDYLTLPFDLVSHLDLHLEAGATIQFPKDKSLYEKMYPLTPRPDYLSKMDGNNASLIYGDKLTDIALTGAGTIDGGGEAWWAAARDRTATVGPIHGRPKLIILTGCQRVHIDGLTIQNSPMWQVVPVMCSDVTLENLKVLAPQRSPNTDALNPTACTNVLIRNCDLSVGDDNIALKALGGPNANIWIENVHSKFGHGISVGSETYGGVHDVTVLNCTFDGGDNALRIKSARDRGNQLYNFTFSNITIDHVKNPILVTMYYSGSKVREAQPITATTPFLRNVKFNNITIRNAGNAGQILGLPEAPATDIVLSNVDIEADTGFKIQDTKGCIFDNVKISVKKGEKIIDPYKAGLTIKP